MTQRYYRAISYIFIITFGIISFAYSSVRSQSVRIEPTLAYEYGYPLTLERTPGIINHFGTNGTGQSYNNSFGLGVIFALPDLFSEEFGILPCIEYRLGKGNFTSDQFQAYDGVASNGQPAASTNKFIVTSNVHAIDVSIPVQYLAGHFGLSAGPWGSFELIREITGTEYILSSGATFTDGLLSRKFASGDTISSSRFHSGLEAGISLELPLSKSIILVPRLFSRLDLVAAAFSKAMSVGLSFSLRSRPSLIQEQPAIIDSIHEVIKPKPRIEASIHFTKNGERITANNNIEVSGYRTFFRQYTEFIPEINFAPGSEILPVKYAQLDRSESASFSIASLAHADLSEYSRQTLNILGYRLRQNPSAHITIQSSYSEYEDQSKAKRRAKVLKEYLSGVWNISSNEVTNVISVPARYPVIWLSVSEQSVVSPLATQWIERSYHIPHMGIEKNIIAEAGVRRWDITISQNEKVLSGFSSAEPGEQRIADFDLLSDSSMGSFSKPAPLVAKISLEDFTGQRVDAFDTLALPPPEELEKNMVNRQSFIFHFLKKIDTVEGQKHSRELLLDKLFKSICKGAHIIVATPFSKAFESTQSIAEKIVGFSKLHSELDADIHIIPGSVASAPEDPYQNTVTVTIEQSECK